MPERKLMKDGLDKHAVSRLSSSLVKLFPEFEDLAFQMAAFEKLDDLELKDRVHFLVELLGQFLPQDFPSTALALQHLPEVWDYGHQKDSLSGFAAWPAIDYIAAYGLDHPDASLETLRRLTGLFSAEFAIRPFLLKHSDLTISHLVQWLDDEDEHVRRLVSEGTRPRLPWAQHLRPFIEDPAESLHLLDGLKDDPSEYVRRSVANHLNDISKDHPQLTLRWCQTWIDGASPEREWIVRHALRSLVKKGDPEALKILGYTPEPKISVSPVLLDSQQVLLGQIVSFTFDVESNADQKQKLAIDYAIHFAKANGRTSPKVFKLKSLELEPLQRKRIVKSHSFEAISTRRYYEGEHRVEVLINGESHGEQSFMFYP